MSALLPIVLLGGVAAIAYASGKKKTKKSKTLTPTTAYGLRMSSNCDVSVVNDGPGLELIDAVTAELYPGMFGEYGPFAPAGGAEQVLATTFRTAFPSCTWPPTRATWRFTEAATKGGGITKKATWAELVAAWEAKFAERRGDG